MNTQMPQRRKRLLSWLVAIMLLCGAGVTCQRIAIPTNRDLGIVFSLPSHNYNAVALDPAATRLAVVDDAGGIRIITIADGQEKLRLPNWEPASVDVTAPKRDRIAFSPDGQYLAQWGWRGLRAWSIAQQRQIPLSGLPASPISALTFLDSGQLQARAATGGIYRFQLSDGTSTLFPATPLARWETWAFGGRGRWALACKEVPGAGSIPDLVATVSKVGGPEVGRVVVPEGGSCIEVAMSPDETLLAAKSLGEDYYLLDWRTSRVRQTIKVDSSNDGGGIAFSPDSTRVFLSGNKVISVRDTRHGFPVGVVRALPVLDLTPPVRFGQLQLSGDGRFLLASCGDIVIRVWRLE